MICPDESVYEVPGYNEEDSIPARNSNEAAEKFAKNTNNSIFDDTFLKEHKISDYKKNYNARSMVAMLTELQAEMEKEKQNTEHLHYDDLENAERYNTGIDNCIDIVQDKINKLKEK